ncbi:uncharacterized protein [Clytia hemisphaerica]|uniref:uncharacterized protein n=1 Tax=Clytia hemisphaerica TaxID=252671 RepID=UPI0034D6750E
MVANHKWKIGTINVRTGRDDIKLNHIINEINKANLSICAIQELRRLSTGSATIPSVINEKTTKYEIYWKGHISKRIHGVGIAVKIDPGIDIKDIKYISARIISMDVIVYGCSLKIVNAYAPTEGDSESMKNTFYRQLKNEISNLAPNQKIVCAGDFNATTSASWSNSSLRENSIINNLEVNNNGERFHELFDTCRLSVLNTWFHHKRCRRVTWYSADGVTEKVYDFILTDSWLRQYCLNCRVYRSFDFDSDHRLVIATMNTPLTKKARYRKRTVKKKAKNLDLATFNNDENLQLNFLQSTITNLNSKPLDDATNNPSKSYTPEELNNNLPRFIPELQRISQSIQINDEPPNLDEIDLQLKKLKSNKASNDVQPDLLNKLSHPIMLQVIHRMSNRLWNDIDVPSAWGNSRLQTLWKGKGSKKDPQKYRGLSIGSTVCKLMVNIVLERLRPWYESQIADEQNGFRKDRGTTDGIYTIKRIQQISNRKQQPLYLMFVDLTAAFDHIPRKWLFDSIRLRFTDGSCPRMFPILEKLYSNTSLTFDDANVSFKTSSGVRQGGPESPFLFNLFIDYVMRVFMEKATDIDFFEHKYRINPRSIKRNQRYQLRNRNIKLNGNAILPWCGYADDIVLFLTNLRSLDSAADLLNSTFNRFGLTINKGKTETMILNHNFADDEYPKSIISIDNTTLKNVREFKYLGSMINCEEPNTGNTEINHRIMLATSKFSELSNLLQNFGINLKTRIKFLNSYVRSRLTYSCQNWNLSQAQQDRLDTTYRKFLRRMVRNGQKHVDEKNNDYRMLISNNRLRAICHVKDVSEFIKLQQRNYMAHILRMDIGRSSKMLTFNDNAYSKKGRQMKSLLENVANDSNMTVDGFCNYAQK